MKKCFNTVTGNHLWIDDIWNIETGETSGSIRYTFPYKYVRCMACDLIDDTKIKHNFKSSRENHD